MPVEAFCLVVGFGGADGGDSKEGGAEMSGGGGVGPGTVRVGRFIGRVGVVTMRAVEIGLDLDERVVRRHVQRLEGLGWLVRDAWMWGEGSIVWLTAGGVEGVGLHGVRPVTVKAGRSQPGMTTITRGVLAGFTAARLERRGLRWQSARELEVDEPRWAVRHRHDHGHSTQLPDVAVWLPGAEIPVAIVCEEARRREDRQRWRLEGWRDAIDAGRYQCVQYDCATKSLATWIENLGKKVRLTHPELRSVVQMPPEKIVTLSPIDPTAKPTPPAPTPAAVVRPQLRLVEPPPPLPAAPPPEQPGGPYVPLALPTPELAAPPAGPAPPENPGPWVQRGMTEEEYKQRRQTYFEWFGTYDSFEPPENPKRRWFR